MRKEIKSVGVLSVAVFTGVLAGCFATVVSLAKLSLVLLGTAVQKTVVGEDDPGTGMLVIIFTPIYYAITGFIAGAFNGHAYNLISRLIGGVEIEID